MSHLSGPVHRHLQTREELLDAVRRQARDDADSDEEDYLRPPGELAHLTTTPLSVAETRPTSPAAEIQQNLLPPRIARVGGVTLAGNVLPGYEIGGDWFDYTENPQSTWLGIADSADIGPSAAGIGAVTLGAFRSVRRESSDPAESLLAMHEVLSGVADGRATSTATVGLWNAPASTVRAIEDALRETHPEHLEDDATIIVLAPRAAG